MMKQSTRSNDWRVSGSKTVSHDGDAHVCSKSKSLRREGEDRYKVSMVYDKDSDTYIRGHNSKIITQWFPSIFLQGLVAIAEPGDLLEFDHDAYRHWAVYVGMESTKRKRKETFVLNFAKSADGQSSEMVHKTPLAEVAGTCRVRINNSCDKWYEPTRDFDLMLKRSQRFMKGSQYKLLTNNCEHFVMYCRYGKTFRNQSSPIWDEVEKISPSSAAANIIGGGITGLWIGGPIGAVAGMGMGICSVVGQAVAEAGMKVLREHPRGYDLKAKHCSSKNT